MFVNLKKYAGQIFSKLPDTKWPLTLFSRCLAVSTALAWSVSLVHSSGNFEFVAKGQAGLNLVVVGFSPSGRQIFQETTSVPENRNGQSVYVVRVDDTLLKQSSLAQWCVFDAAGKWNLLFKERTQVALCDDRPVETGGSYRFESRIEKSKSILGAIDSVKVADVGVLDNSFNFKVGKNIPDIQVNTIKDGFVVAQAHLNKVYGGAIPLELQKSIRVRIESSGNGDAQEGGGAPAAMSWMGGGPKLYFDVTNPQWNQGDAQYGWGPLLKNKKAAIHEYVHAWQGVLMKKGLSTGKWIDEGIAEYIAFDAMVGAGLVSQRDADLYLLNTAKKSDGTSRPLKAYIKSTVWPGEIGAVAINWLVSESPKSKMSLRIFAMDIGAGKSTAAAFADAFDIELDEFYNSFELYRTMINANDAATVIKARPSLRNIHEAGGYV